MIVGKRFYAYPITHNSIYSCVEKAKKRMSLSHYTNVEALLKILSEKKLKANRIDYMDDLQEKRFIQEAFDQNETIPYVVCFDNTLAENIALWYMYTKNDTGIRITFFADKKYNRDIFKSLFVEGADIEAYKQGQEKPVLFSQFRSTRGEYVYQKVYVNTKISDVIYNEAIANYYKPFPASDIKDWLIYAVLKAKEWRFQHETRVVADFELFDYVQGKIENIPRFEYLKLPIWFDIISKIEIVFSPWMGEEMKNMIREHVQNMELGEIKDKLIFKNSKFTGLINRK